MMFIPDLLQNAIKNGLFQKKLKQGGRDRRVEAMEFLGVLKKNHVEIPGVN